MSAGHEFIMATASPEMPTEPALNTRFVVACRVAWANRREVGRAGRLAPFLMSVRFRITILKDGIHG